MKVREKGRRKTVVCTNLKQTSTKCILALYGVKAMLEKISYVNIKNDM